jgi:hypothetical protein
MEVHLSAVHLVRATIASVSADEDLHERRFARAVAAGESVDLTPAQVEIHLAEDRDAAE